jgi:serine/threonine-protein kinase
MVFTPGMRLADRYRLVERIGVGGMSEVWRASDELLDRQVAVKALASPLATDPALRAGTRQEAKAAARLTHPHVTQVYDYGELTVPDGPPVPYLVMELVVGRNLAERLSRGPLPWREAVRVAAQVADGLAAAHRLGVVHHDIKPGNVMLTATGAKILDFGIATLAGAQPTTDGPLIGTPAYTAPERLAGTTGPASDVYALGALLYEALTGRKAVPVSSWEEAADAHRRGVRPAPPQVPGLPEEVAALCLACLAGEPAARPGMGEVAARLAATAGKPEASPVEDATRPRAVPSPTLIDRSPSIRSGRATGGTPGRIAASAAVVYPAPAPAPTPAEPARRPYRTRRATLAAAGTVVAAGITLALVATAAHEPEATGATGGTTTTPPVVVETPEPPTQSAEPEPSTGPSTGPGIVEEFNRLLDEAVAAGLISSRAADDLRDKLADVQEELRKRRVNRNRVGEKVADLREKIREHAEEGRIGAETADRLEWLLAPLIADGGRDNGDDD